MTHIYAMDDGTVLNTAKAMQSWKETTYEEGNPDGRRWSRGVRTCETLYYSSKGTYWTEAVYNWPGIATIVRVLTPREAAAWLLIQRHALPDNLAAIAKDIEE